MQDLLRGVVMAVWSNGGQGTARRNAWAAMVADARRARERADADSAVDAAEARHEISTATAQA